jgi:serine-type D-Ala-D-Ala carboxypeptidase/endopeptidase (penicillin-binding protein 4)
MIAFHRSPPISKIIKQTNKESDNVCAQHLFKAIGAKVKGRGTCDNANEAIARIMKDQGVDTTGFVMADGSGLSTYNRISPHQICGVFMAMMKSPNWKDYWASLPIAGVDGTLVYRMHGLPVRAKTGGLQGHIALSGYVKTKTGQMVVFSMLTNSHKTSGDRIRLNEDTVVQMIAGWDRKL